MAPRVSLEQGIEVIRTAAKTLPAKPGVYRMLGADHEPLYIGKARSLDKRVFSYTQTARHPRRLLRMIAETVTMEFIVTRSEVEALLLEANLIRKLHPKYNIAFRDDKSYPLIILTTDHDFPQLIKHRGARTRKGDYFGPFASAGAVNQTLDSLQKAFMLRNCTDSYFAQRRRPCLQYHIKRCTAPCVNYVNKDDYAQQVVGVRNFLKNKSNDAQEKLVDYMQAAAARNDFELAAVFRDRIRAMTLLQSKQATHMQGVDDLDVIAAHSEGGRICIQIFFYRGGASYGNRAIFPTHAPDDPVEDVIAAFLIQYYDDKLPPPEILLNFELPEAQLLTEALTERAGAKVELSIPKRGQRRELVEQAERNAKEALERHITAADKQEELLEAVGKLFNLPTAPERIEVYDNSHIQGEFAVGAMIVATKNGFDKKSYRKFNIKTVVDSRDDYAMMAEVLRRRFTRALAERENWPSLVIIDGGAGQLSTICALFQELGISDMPVVAISKGVDRNAGREFFHMPGRDAFQLPINDPTLYYLQRLRDEAHRFVIGSHRNKRAAAISLNPLDEVAGIGTKRKKALLQHFGSARAVSSASIEDIMAAGGVSRTLAQTIYDHFHSK